MLAICKLTNKPIGIWKQVPGYYDRKDSFIRYDRTWFCNYSKTIHNNLKQRLQCKSCNKEYKIKNKY